MPSTFRRDEVVDWFRQHYPSVKPNTVTAHITAATVNSRSRHHYPGAEQHLIFRLDDRLLERYDSSRHGRWNLWGEQVSDNAVSPASPPQDPKQTLVQSGQDFETYARIACSHHFGVELKSAVIEVIPAVPHQFDLVSSDRRIVGDAKYFKNIAVPAAKWSVIAEYVWLLQHLPATTEKFIVFGQDREVPDRWLQRFRPLTEGIGFYFLSDNDTELIPI